MDQFFPYLEWIDTQQNQMLARVKDWADINSHSLNVHGLNVMLAALQREFTSLGATAETIPLDSMETVDSKGAATTLNLGSALHLSKRENASIRFFLGGHYDTVYPIETNFINCWMVDQNTLIGPGVADMKGGLAIMLTALEALERSPFAEHIGYEILLNPDEEIGSPGSSYLFEDLSKNCRAALLFEPAFSDESLAGARKGSSNHTILVKGTSAHAGRDFFSGKSAIAALSELLIRIHELNHPERNTTLNLGYIYGGGPVNIVPDLALCRINIRAVSDEEMHLTESHLNEMIQELAKKHEVKAQSYVESRRPPKPFDEATEKLFMEFQNCGNELGQKIMWNPTGGACDGNTVAAQGIPAIDSLGAIGGSIHTHDEFLLVDSLTKRAKLTALYLMKAADEKSR